LSPIAVWIMEENPQATLDLVLAFLRK